MLKVLRKSPRLSHLISEKFFQYATKRNYRVRHQSFFLHSLSPRDSSEAERKPSKVVFVIEARTTHYNLLSTTVFRTRLEHV